MRFRFTEFEEFYSDMSHKRENADMRLEVPMSKRTPYIFFGVISLVIGLFWVRAGYLSLWQGQEFSVLAARNTERIFPILSPRGIMYDRTGEALVENTPSFRLVVDRSRMPKDKALLEEQLGRIGSALGANIDMLTEQMMRASETPYFILARGVSQESAVALSILQYEENMLWIDVETVPERAYVDGKIFSHVIGYTGEMSKDDLVSYPGAFATEEIGKNGIESSYDDILRGVTGKKVFVVDSRGRTDRSFVGRETESGTNIRLGIDAALQRVLYASLERETRRAGATSGAAVAIDPRDGSVRALVSFPSYDNNLFARGISSAEYSKIADDARKPLLNRAVSGVYPVGSTVKPVVGLAALSENVINASRRISDPGFISVQNIYDPSIVYTFRDWKAHGSVNFTEAIAESCDVYFYTVGGGYGDIKGLGIERLSNWLKKFGFNEKTGIDIPGEKSGLVPTPEWKEKEKGEPWVLGDTYHVSIGQGDLLGTPLELAVATAAIANGGTLLKPHIVDAVLRHDGGEDKVPSEIIRAIDASSSNIGLVKKGMRATVASGEGTAKMLSQVPVSVSAKTGTAEVGSKRTHAWLTAFAPSENPELVLVILVEHGGEGSAVAAPVARDALSAYFDKE